MTSLRITAKWPESGADELYLRWIAAVNSKFISLLQKLGARLHNQIGSLFAINLLVFSEIQMSRVAFRLRLKPGSIEAYESSHRQVWPELLDKLKSVGISDYSIFRRDQDLFLVMRVDDFEGAWDQLAGDPVNLRWQSEMSKYFEPVADLKPGERFAMMKEVFYLE